MDGPEPNRLDIVRVPRRKLLGVRKTEAKRMRKVIAGVLAALTAAAFGMVIYEGMVPTWANTGPTLCALLALPPSCPLAKTF
jgi:hypothetical protein